MKRFLLTFVFSGLILALIAQEKTASDTIVRVPEKPALKLSSPMAPMISDEMPPIDLPVLADPLLFRQPLLPAYNKNLDFLKYLKSSGVKSMSFSDMSIGFFPYFSTGKVFNQSSYQLNDKLLIGGNSFGVQSVFDKPKVNPTIQDMSTKGASMFLQYNVSKNFKVEGRVSVTNHSGPFQP